MNTGRWVGRCVLAASVALAGTACASGRAAGNPLVAALAREDQAVRTGGSAARSDADRVRLVLGEIARGRVSTPEDRFGAALVLQHSGLAFRDGELVALSPNDYLLAHYLAMAAFAGGYARARTLVAQTGDRAPGHWQDRF